MNEPVSTEPKANRTLRLDIRVSEAENSIILQNAHAAQLPLSEYVRRVAMGQSVQSALSAEERAALVGIGRNLNQAMKLSHHQQQLTADLVGLIEQLKHLLAR